MKASCVKLSLKIVSCGSFLVCSLKYFSSYFKIRYGGDVPAFYQCKENDNADSLKEESYQVGCVKRGTALKLNFEVDSPGSVLRYAALHENETYLYKLKAAIGTDFVHIGIQIPLRLQNRPYFCPTLLGETWPAKKDPGERRRFVHELIDGPYDAYRHFE